MSICSDCEYYHPTNGKGYCKQDSPHLSPTQDGTSGVWPVVDGENEVCGKFEPSV